MKIFRLVLISFLVLIFMGIIAGGVFVRYSSRKSLPDYNQNLVISSLKDSVEVFRDSTAMPHIYASNEMDLYKAVGYLMAQDRIWQMDLLRRLTTGRLAEILGKDLIETDRLFRSLNFREKSKMALDSSTLKLRNILQAYAEGVNQYLEDHVGKLPPEFSILGYEPEPWEIIHSVNLIVYMSWNLSAGWGSEMTLWKIMQKVDSSLYRELVPDMSLEEIYVYPELKDHEEETTAMLRAASDKISELGLQVFMASNIWTISGSKTKSGKPILANDMHLGLNIPGIWYQMHQVVPGKLNVSGLVLPGQPFIICGHNEKVAWGMTNVMVDNTDFYLETISKKDTTKYFYNGKWHDIKFKKEKILIRNDDPVTTYNRYTHRGPIISEFQGLDSLAISMRWIGNDYSNELRSVYLFNRMKSWKELLEASETFVAISENIAYADADGNIGMLTAAGIPIREGNGIFIAPGDTSLYDWKGIVAFDEVPREINPEKGFLASANNRTVGTEYPYYISNWFDLPHRIERITESLGSMDNIGIAEMQKLQADQVSEFAEDIVPFFLENIKGQINDAPSALKTAFSLLDTWDYDMGMNSVEASLFEQMFYEFVEEVFRDELGNELFNEFIGQDLLARYFVYGLSKGKSSSWIDNVGTEDKTETISDITYAALNNTVESLSEKLGDDMNDWQWGKIHTLTLEHPLGSIKPFDRAFKLNRGPYPVGGSTHTVSPFTYSLKKRFKAFHGSSHRHIYTAGDWDQSKIIIPTGNSGIPASSHYCDQTNDYLAYRYNPGLYSRDKVVQNKAYYMKFTTEEEISHK